MQTFDIKQAHQRLLAGDRSVMEELYANKGIIQNFVMFLLDAYKNNTYDDKYNEDLDTLMRIFNIIYNNFDAEPLVDDGIYDMLMNMYKQIYPDVYQVGADFVPIDYTSERNNTTNATQYYYPFKLIDESRKPVDQWMFRDQLFNQPPVNPAFYEIAPPKDYPEYRSVTINAQRRYRKLSGTLDKCKFTLIKEVLESNPDILNDPTIKIFERDFLGKLVSMGALNPNHIKLLVELKMDGFSVETEVTDRIHGARSRGDANTDIADDLTVIFKDYKFPRAVPVTESFGMLFECIITKTNLEIVGRLKGKSYKNARNGVIGIMKGTDAYKYRDFITLVPLKTSLDIDPVDEVKFMNQYYTKDVALPYAVIEGDYNTVLYQVYEFVKEAESMREISNFMYDGVVVHIADKNARDILGTKNSVDQFSMAIKFNPLTKRSIFRGWSFEVGQNGIVIPMAHYDPVEFIGTIHTKSSCHSYGRFQDLALCEGDPVYLTYVNDVMPYLTKRPGGYNDIDEYFEHVGQVIPFPTVCPFCGSPLTFFYKDDGTADSAYCPNFTCPERQISRVANMLDKLTIRGFAESAVKKLKLRSFKDYLTIQPADVALKLGPGNAKNFVEARELFLNSPIPDYRMVGALGFTDIAAETWKKILIEVPIDAIMNSTPNDLSFRLRCIKGIGQKTADIIIKERPYFMEDLNIIRHMPNCQVTYGVRQKQIRWTGCRDKTLEDDLVRRGYDANSKSGVTKATDLLIVPYTGYTSTKLTKIGPQTKIVAIEEFRKNIDWYLSQI